MNSNSCNFSSHSTSSSGSTNRTTTAVLCVFKAAIAVIVVVLNMVVMASLTLGVMLVELSSSVQSGKKSKLTFLRPAN